MKFYIILLLSLFSLNHVHAMTNVQAKVATVLTGLALTGATGYYIKDDIKKIIDPSSKIHSNSSEREHFCTGLVFAWAGTVASCFFFKHYTPRGYYHRGLEAINDLDHNLLVRILSSRNDKKLLLGYSKSIYKKSACPLTAALHDLQSHEIKILEINSLLKRAIAIKDAEPEIVNHSCEIIKKFDTNILPAVKAAQTRLKNY